MKRLLVVNPRWADPSAPDTLRVRSMLPHLEKCGWRATVVAAVGPAEPDRDADVHRVNAWPRGLTRLLGFGSDGLRSYAAIGRRLRALLAEQRFDLAFFSTTAFELWRLAPRLARAGVPYALDWQDPWFDPSPPPSVRASPPGGRLKFATTQFFARHSEPLVARMAAGHVAVSAVYLEALHERYDLRAETPMLVEPFATDPVALRRARACAVPWSHDARVWVSIGRLGDGFVPTLDAFFSALARLPVQAREPIRLRFVGTGYGTNPQPMVVPIATRHGLGSMVEEQPARVSPDAALAQLAHAERILVFASDDDRYVPSRLANALGTGRPVVVVAPRGCPSAWRAFVDDVADVAIIDAESHNERLPPLLERAPSGFGDRDSFLARHSASAMTQRLASFFDVLATKAAQATAPV